MVAYARGSLTRRSARVARSRIGAIAVYEASRGDFRAVPEYRRLRISATPRPYRAPRAYVNAHKKTNRVLPSPRPCNRTPTRTGTATPVPPPITRLTVQEPAAPRANLILTEYPVGIPRWLNPLELAMAWLRRVWNHLCVWSASDQSRRDGI